MNDEDFHDHCAAAAVSGLLARYEGDDEQLRHHYHVLTVEAFRVAAEMVEYRRKLRERRQSPD